MKNFRPTKNKPSWKRGDHEAPKHFGQRPPQRPSQKPEAPGNDRDGAGWNHVADWYTKHLDSNDTYQESVIFPQTIKLLNAPAGASVLDIGCGEGALAELLVKKGLSVRGVDAAPQLIAAASRRRLHNAEFSVGDARQLGTATRGQQYTAATCIMAIQNIPEVPPVFRGAAAALKPNAPFVIVTLHPAFRIPRQSTWGWDEDRKIMYRRIDRYLEPLSVPIVMNPGRAVQRNSKPVTTMTYHRPISFYINALAEAGFTVDRLEEWTSHRSSDSGPRAKAENRAREEFPLFLAIRARRK